MLCSNRFGGGSFLAAVNVYVERSTVTPVTIYQCIMIHNLKHLNFFFNTVKRTRRFLQFNCGP